MNRSWNQRGPALEPMLGPWSRCLGPGAHAWALEPMLGPLGPGLTWPSFRDTWGVGGVRKPELQGSLKKKSSRARVKHAEVVDQGNVKVVQFILWETSLAQNVGVSVDGRATPNMHVNREPFCVAGKKSESFWSDCWIPQP